MLFDIKFEIVKIHESGAMTVGYLKGTRKEVKKDIEIIKKQSKNYEMVGKNGMIVWV